MPGRNDGRRVGTRMALVVLGLLAGNGCSHFQGGGSHPPSGPPQWSTIGTDRSKIPRGQTIPPAGFGVDLVESSRATKDAIASAPLPRTTRTQDDAVSAAGF